MPRRVVVPTLVVAEQLQEPVSVRRTDASLSIRRHRLLRSIPQIAQHPPQLRRRLQRAHRTLQRLQPFQMHRTRNPPPALRPPLVRAVHSPSERTSQKTWLSSVIAPGMSSSRQIESSCGAAGTGYSTACGRRFSRDSGRPSAYHLSNPPCRILKFVCPNRSNVHHVRAAYSDPDPSYPTTVVSGVIPNRPTNRAHCSGSDIP